SAQGLGLRAIAPAPAPPAQPSVEPAQNAPGLSAIFLGRDGGHADRPCGDTSTVAKDQRIELLVTAEQRAAYDAEANRAGLSLSAWLRRSADEAVELGNALEAQVEDARQAQRRHEAAEQNVSRPAPSRPQQRMGDRRPWGVSVGDALRRADANHRR